MTPDERRGLLALVDAVPAGTAIPVPREWLREMLAGDTQPLAARDLTVPEVAARYGRHPATVRGWLERDLLPGAYKLRGRDWRIPTAVLAEFERAEAAARREGAASQARRPSAVDITAWRRVS